jgi:hypothetical protein
VLKAFALLECYAAYVGSCLPTFRDSLSVGLTFSGQAVQEEISHLCLNLLACYKDRNVRHKVP